MFHDLFFRHPHAVGETYRQHFTAAFELGWAMIVAGAACLVHALIPRLFERTASEAVCRLHSRISARRPVSAPRGEIDYAI